MLFYTFLCISEAVNSMSLGRLGSYTGTHQTAQISALEYRLPP